MSIRHCFPLAAALLTAGLMPNTPARAEYFVQTNLVSNIAGLATFTDTNLKNPWGISSSAASPFWISNQLSGNTTLYNSAGTPQALVVTTPGGAGAQAGPTGQVFNSTTSFLLSNNVRATFIFANLNGSISAWNNGLGTNAQNVVLTPAAVYTGLAIGTSGGSGFLYAANQAGNRIDVFNGTFQNVSLTGNFTDPNLPSGFTPYNIQNLGGTLYVTYRNATTGGGVVDAFGLDGSFLRRVAANGASGPLQTPWGLAIAPAGFGSVAGKLLVGNETDGRISIFDPTTGAYGGQLLDAQGNPIANPGLKGLIVGNGGNGGNANTIYFAAGINGRADGLFGSISAVPEPGSVILLGLGGVCALAICRRPR